MSSSIIRHTNYTLLIVELSKLDSTVSQQLKAEIVGIEKNNAINLVIDITQVRYCDSSGLGALLLANRLFNTEKSKFILLGSQPTVKKLIQISQLDSILVCKDTLEELEPLFT